MAKELTLTVWAESGDAGAAIIAAVNEALNRPDIYALIHDEDNEGWSWYMDHSEESE